MDGNNEALGWKVTFVNGTTSWVSDRMSVGLFTSARDTILKMERMEQINEKGNT